MLHEGLLGLPAEMYLKLYHKMQEKVIAFLDASSGSYDVDAFANVF